MKVFACTHVSKEVAEDTYEGGCSLERTCTMDERVNITADSLAELLKRIGDRFCINIDDCWVPDESPGRMGYNRLENGEGNEPTENILEKWKAGKQKLWLADYDFLLEVREVRPVVLADFEAEKITTHD